MAAQPVSVWYDAEGDFLEVMFDLSREGYFRETDDDRVMEKVDDEGRFLGFSILALSTIRGKASVEFTLGGGGREL